MILDKVDLCEARAAFERLWIPRYGHVCPGSLEGDYQYCLERLREGVVLSGWSISGQIGQAVLAARKRNRPKKKEAIE